MKQKINCVFCIGNGKTNIIDLRQTILNKGICTGSASVSKADILLNDGCWVVPKGSAMD